MVAKGVIVGLTLLTLADRSLSLQCEPTCRPEYCLGPRPTCSYGTNKGPCGCCDECSKGPSEKCGGVSPYYHGECAVGLECVVMEDPFDPMKPWISYEENYEGGTCVERGDENEPVSTTTEEVLDSTSTDITTGTGDQNEPVSTTTEEVLDSTSTDITTGRAYLSGCRHNKDCLNIHVCINIECIDPCHYVGKDYCGVNAVCEVVDHRPVCHCPPGYQGDPQRSCEEPFNPCDQGPCGEGARCELYNGNPICYCPKGTTGDPFVKCTSWRLDWRCASSETNHLAPNGEPAQCIPYGHAPCCSFWGWCGISDEHCLRYGTDYRIELHDPVSTATEEVLDTTPTNINTQTGYWRPDWRCAYRKRSFFAPLGSEPAQCNPHGHAPCCSSHGWCGITPEHCDCRSCTDYRDPTLFKGMGPYNDVLPPYRLSYYDSFVSWDDAKKKCSSKNGRLVSLSDPEDDESVWLGGSGNTKKDDWVWLNGNYYKGYENGQNYRYVCEEKCSDSNTRRCNKNSTHPTPDTTDQPYTSVKPSATTQLTTEFTDDSSFQSFTSVKPSATIQSTPDITTNTTDLPLASVYTSATSQPNDTNIHFELYLYKASARGDVTSVNQALRSAGPHLAWGNPDKKGVTALHAAAQFNHPDVLTILLNAGADKDQRDYFYRTPLYYASRYGSIDAITVLISHGAIIDMQDNRLENSALHQAAKNNHTTIVTALLDAGASINQTNGYGRTPLSYASIFGSFDAASVLLARGAGIDIPDNNNETPIYLTSAAGSIDLVNILIDYGADLNIPNNDGTTPVAAASKRRHLHVVEALVAAGADVNIPNMDGNTALHQAAKNNHTAIATALLDAGASINQTNGRGRTPLNYASIFGSFDAASVLIARGAGIDIPDNKGETPLVSAANSNHPAIVSALLDAGADKDYESKSLGTPIGRASYKGYIDVVNILIAHGANVGIKESNEHAPLLFAADFNHSTIVSALLDAGAEIDRQGYNNETPIYLASAAGSIDSVNILIDYGADLNIPSNDGITPVAAASKRGHLQVVEALVAAGADVNIPNMYGHTALHQAAQGWWKNSLEIAKVLLHNGADASKQDNQGRTPVALPQEVGHQPMVDIFNSFTTTSDK